MNVHAYLNTDVVKIQKEKENSQKEQYGSTLKTIDDLSLLGHDQPVVYLIGCNDIRGMDEKRESLDMPHTSRIRETFYKYYNWHPEVSVFDLGDLKTGSRLEDTYAALEQVFDEIGLEHPDRKSTVILFGGSADQIVGAYNAYKKRKQKVECLGINAVLPILANEAVASNAYLLELLVEENSFLEHYSHIGYQSYLTSVGLLENLDKFSFENIRLGQVKENIDRVEPLFRNADIISFDLRALAPTAYPMFHNSPTGFSGEEACRLMQFAGMATKTSLVHIAGYDARKDIYNHYSMAIAQMMWYAIDGFVKYLGDVPPIEKYRQDFDEYKMVFADYSSSFFQSKHSNRWWMIGPNKEYIPCDYSDYEQATQAKIPEKWLRSITK